MNLMTWCKAAVTASAAVVLSAGPAWAAPSNSDLDVVRIDPDATFPGGETSLHAFVANLGPETTNSTMTITVELPRGTEAKAPYFPDDCEASGNGRRVRCEFPAGLKARRTATAIVPIHLDQNLRPGTVLEGSFAVHSPDDRNPLNNRTTFEIRVIEPDSSH
ncbi:hypothetical protein [Streptomyces sp. NPDC058157]|uniref:hypothetical protein n=1 Tax=Streptomyces sp. NPDC058157 TaxID=3346360 RepID=UPI0036EBA61D